MTAHMGPLDDRRQPGTPLGGAMIHRTELRNRAIAPERGWRVVDILGAPSLAPEDLPAAREADHRHTWRRVDDRPGLRCCTGCTALILAWDERNPE